MWCTKRLNTELRLTQLLIHAVYKKKKKKTFVSDDDECLLKIDNCQYNGPDFVCRNTLGSFRCERKPNDNCNGLCLSNKTIQQQCPQGYQLNANRKCEGMFLMSAQKFNWWTCNKFYQKNVSLKQFLQFRNLINTVHSVN